MLSLLRQGHYYYNNKIYLNRQSAFDDMLLNKDYNSSITFHFNEDVFDNINWEIEPDIDIGILYKMRAQQIRDKYNYIILSFSGGSDSTQILWTFLKNNIFIDEIQIANYNEIVSKMDHSKMIKDDMLSEYLEYDYAAVPILKKVAEISPNTKITIIDVSKDLVNNYKKSFGSLGFDDDNFHNGTQRLYLSIPRMYSYSLSRYNALSINPPNNSCIVKGFEKPGLSLDLKNRDTLYFTFNDMTMRELENVRRKQIPDDFVSELFFWSRDFPLIPIKQSHMIKRVLESNKDFYDLFFKRQITMFKHDLSKKAGYSSAHSSERMINYIIYPDWDPTVFTAPKPTSFQIEPDACLVKNVIGDHHGGEARKESISYFNNKYSLIKDKYQFVKTFLSKKYQIGRMNIKWLI
jgi:hypothetical protein